MKEKNLIKNSLKLFVGGKEGFFATFLTIKMGILIIKKEN